MGIFSKLFAALKKIITKIVSFVGRILKKIWPVLLIIGAVFFAPSIAGWLTTSGAPSWLSGFFDVIGTTITPGLQSLGAWALSAGSSLFSGAGAVWSSLSLGTKASLVLGAATLLAPEEMADLATEIGTTIGDVVGAGAGAIASGFASSPFGMLAIGAVLLFLLSRSSSNE